MFSILSNGKPSKTNTALLDQVKQAWKESYQKRIFWLENKLPELEKRKDFTRLNQFVGCLNESKAFLSVLRGEPAAV